jgi:hypothetical protein
MKAEAALDAINKVLFPPPRLGEMGLKISSDACINLQGVMIDIEDVDPVCYRTVRRVHQQLVEVKRILHQAGYK